MRRNEVHGVAIPAMDISKLGIADADGILQHGCKDRLKIAGRTADNLKHLRRRGLLLQRLLQLAAKPRDLCFLVGRGGTVTARGLWRIAALWRCRFTSSRFNRFAACFGAPSHCLPLGSGRGIVGGHTSTSDGAACEFRQRSLSSRLMSLLGHLRRFERMPGMSANASDRSRITTQRQA